MKFRILLIFSFLVFASVGFAQQEKAKELIEQKIEELTESSEKEYDYSELYDVLMNLYLNPINLNTATYDDLAQIPFLNEIQINLILDHIKKNGQFLSLYELKDIKGFEMELIFNILPFVRVEKIEKSTNISFSNFTKYGSHELFLRESRVLETQKGFVQVSDSVLNKNPNAMYLGDPNRLYMKYHYHYKDRVSIGFTADKDAGEEFFKGSNPYGFDFYTFHAFAQGFRRVKVLALGDYHLEFGQGLTLCTGLSFGKSSSSISAQKRGRGIKANTSANENLFLRGAATTIEIVKNLDITAFYSRKGIDGNLQQADTLSQEDFIFTSLQESGYHRTPGELENKRAITLEIFGGHLQYKNKGFVVGTTAYHSQFDKNLLKNLSPYQYFDFQGKENYDLGVDFSYANTLMSFFGEASQSKNGGKAIILGSLFNLNSKLQMSLVYRNFSKDYQSFYSATFSESGKTQNEKGLFIGTELGIGDKNMITAYYDIYRFPWLKFRVDAPSDGDEFSFQWLRNENRYLSYYVKFRTETKSINSSGTLFGENSLIQYTKQSFRFNMNYAVTKLIRIKSVVETSLYTMQNQPNSRGFVMYQDIKLKMLKLPIDWSFRYAIFNTDDYDSRIYAYEDNVLYAFSIPGYYYKGQRMYLLANYEITKKIDFWIRYSITIFDNKTLISSGLEEITGNKKSEIIGQLRIKF